MSPSPSSSIAICSSHRVIDFENATGISILYFHIVSSDRRAEPTLKLIMLLSTASVQMISSVNFRFWTSDFPKLSLGTS